MSSYIKRELTDNIQFLRRDKFFARVVVLQIRLIFGFLLDHVEQIGWCFIDNLYSLNVHLRRQQVD